jgi:hypothetical protein
MRNIWRDFLGRLPSSPLYVVEVMAHNSDGTSTVAMPTGDEFIVRGQSVDVGQFAFVRDGAIEGEAPAVTPITLDV